MNKVYHQKKTKKKKKTDVKYLSICFFFFSFLGKEKGQEV